MPKAHLYFSLWRGTREIRCEVTIVARQTQLVALGMVVIRVLQRNSLVPAQWITQCAVAPDQGTAHLFVHSGQPDVSAVLPMISRFCPYMAIRVKALKQLGCKVVG